MVTADKQSNLIILIIISLSLGLTLPLWGAEPVEGIKEINDNSTKYVSNKQTVYKQDLWFSQDKFHHFTASFLGTLCLSQVSMNMVVDDHDHASLAGSSIMVSVGIVKEFSDKKQPNNHFCWKDLTANLLGAGFGMVLFLILNGE